MLVQFSVGNFRSFSEVQTLTLVAAPLTSPGDLDSTNVFAAPLGMSLLRSAAIYGANAAGKSNLLLALGLLGFMASRSLKLEEGEAIPTEPFLLFTETENAPSFFEIVFFADGVRYRYGLELSAEEVESEWLYRQTSSRETVLFTREKQVVTPSKVAFKEGIPVKKVGRNHCFLSVCAALQGPIALSVVRWFQGLRPSSGLKDQHSMQYTLTRLIEGVDQADIEEFLRGLDVNLDRVALEFPEGRPRIGKGGGQVNVRVMDESEEVSSVLTSSLDASQGKRLPVKVTMPSPKWNGEGDMVGEAALDMASHGSAGTQKLFAFAGPIVDTLKRGKVLCVDELDARLHPAMTCALVKLFNSPRTNPHNAQLIFATHDVNLLTPRLFRRDQIWFAEKSPQGATHLYSLAQFRLENGELPRKDSSFENDYILGRFGAVPFIGDLSAIFANDQTLASSSDAMSQGESSNGEI